MNKRYITISIFLLTILLTYSVSMAQEETPIRAIRFDPGYYYSQPDSNDVVALSERLCREWKQRGVNTIYYQAHSNDGGARYRTRYLHNRMEDFGYRDLLGAMIDAAHAENMQVIAWIFDRSHKQAWRAHPSWRVKQADGRDYKDRPEDYFLSPFHPEAESWWNGMIEDMLISYSDLDGIDIAEPILNWWGNKADFNPAGLAQFAEKHPGSRANGPEWNQFRANGLTTHLENTIWLAHKYQVSAHVTIIMTSNNRGRLLTNAEQMQYTGFDLDGLLDSVNRPDFINAELIFQQWKDAHRSARFTPQWTRSATDQAFANVAGRTPLIVHIEASTFGSTGPEKGDLTLALSAAEASGAVHFDCYDANLLDKLGRWDEIALSYGAPSNITLALAD